MESCWARGSVMDRLVAPTACGRLVETDLGRQDPSEADCRECERIWALLKWAAEDGPGPSNGS
jgi:hypothetical protein